MKIKKFTALTEQEAIEKVKKDLGTDALIISIKKIQPRGLFSMFKKAYVEVLAAYEDGKNENIQKLGDTKKENDNLGKNFLESLKQIEEQDGQVRQDDMPTKAQSQTVQTEGIISEQDQKIKRLENLLATTSDMLSIAQKQLKVESFKTRQERRYQNNLVQIFYDTLIQNQVTKEIAAEILDELDQIKESDGLNINFIVKVVYSRIIEIIGEPVVFKPKINENNPQILAFIGPTGVGKTTTIAKLTADFSLNQNINVGLITADTYRIAAIEQLKTYGDILGIDVAVAYKPTDLTAYIYGSKNLHDIILIDTAGRSHKNKENILELQEFLEVADTLEKFLVLSLTTKFEDMLDIVNTFSQICDFKIIFTKMDETTNIGSILNICHLTGKKLSYITFGQNVPNDIKTISPNELAMLLLGLEEE